MPSPDVRPDLAFAAPARSRCPALPSASNLPRLGSFWPLLTSRCLMFPPPGHMVSAMRLQTAFDAELGEGHPRTTAYCNLHDAGLLRRFCPGEGDFAGLDNCSEARCHEDVDPRREPRRVGPKSDVNVKGNPRPASIQTSRQPCRISAMSTGFRRRASASVATSRERWKSLLRRNLLTCASECPSRRGGRGDKNPIPSS